MTSEASKAASTMAKGRWAKLSKAERSAQTAKARAAALKSKKKKRAAKK